MLIPDRCFWLDGLPAIPTAPAPPATVDVAIVGGGYTGLAAARRLAAGGASVVVLERDQFGGLGASGRNGGFVLPGYKVDLPDIVRRHGLAVARTLFEASLAAVAFVERTVTEERIACEWSRTGHVTLAAKPAHMAGLAALRELLRRDFAYETELLSATDLGADIGSSRYAGGLLDAAAGAIHPARYLHGLAAAAGRVGAVLVAGVEVLRLEKHSRGVRLATSKGPIEAGDVLLATNGFSRGLVPWLTRRVIPVGSYLLATAPLDPALARRLLPTGRVVSDTKELLYYFRLSSDDRLIFGGRAAFSPQPLAQNLAALRRGMQDVYPALADVVVEFGWGGTLGFTLDQLPHTGRREGMAYAVGYGGHGVAYASWLGDQVGRAMSGTAPWPALTRLPFRAVPLYRGQPWFLPLAGAYYRMKDILA
ncbi:MAG: FAD-binding oxidoreductase [Gemmatimonadales bacterium]